jgi:hypothetical protein
MICFSKILLQDGFMNNLITFLADPTTKLFEQGKKYAEAGPDQSIWKARGIFLISMPVGITETTMKIVWTTLKTTTHYLSFKYCAKTHQQTELQLHLLIRRVSYIFIFGLLHTAYINQFSSSSNSFDILIDSTRVNMTKSQISASMLALSLLPKYNEAQKHPGLYNSLKTRLISLGMGLTGMGSIFYHTFYVIKYNNLFGKLDVKVVDPTSLQQIKEAMIKQEKDQIEAQYRLIIAIRFTFHGLFGTVFNHRIPTW